MRVIGLEAVPTLDPVLDAAAYRIVQESLANALAHAGAVAATVTFVHSGGELHIRVANGAGSPTDVHVGSGFGLLGMRERAERLGGRLQASRTPDGGFMVEAALPVELQ